MKNQNSTWYRLLKVIYVVVWIFAFIVTGVVAYTFRPYDSVDYYSVGFKCDNGQSWEFSPYNSVYNINYPNFTSSDEDFIRKTCAYGQNYKNNPVQLNAALPDKNYTLYQITSHYGSNDGMWKALAITFLILFLIIESIKSAVLYIIGVPVMRGGLLYVLQLVASLNNDDSKSKENKALKEFDKKYKSVFEIEGKDEILKNAEMLNKSEQGLNQIDLELKDFYKKSGHDESFYHDNDNILDVDLETMETFFRLDDGQKELNYYWSVFNNYFISLEKVKVELDGGMRVEDARDLFKRLEEEDKKEHTDNFVKIEFMKAISEELLIAKREHGDLRSAQLKIADIVGRVYQKHPEWRKET